MNIILLSGGSGKRLWPLSNDIRSKQFIKIFRQPDGSYESMVQRIFRQIKEVDPGATITIATSKSQVSSIYNQLGKNVDISVEPCRRDTFPAIALAAAYLHDKKNISSNEAVVVCPVDPYVEKEYFQCLRNMCEAAEKGNEKLVLMGIEPTYPSEKYGYIRPQTDDGEHYYFSFTEKPTEEKAQEYINSGALWNGGVFAFKLGYVLQKSEEILGRSDYTSLLTNYSELKKESFDYAVVEQEKSIEVLRYSGTWKDLGTWNTLSEAMVENTVGNVRLNETCTNVHVINELGIPIIIMGGKDLVVSASPEGVLVSDKEQSSYIKPFVDAIDQQVMFAEKSWGEFRVLDIEDDSMTIKVTLSPEESMNYHSHDNRSEKWIVISGDGHVILNEKSEKVIQGDEIVINPGVKHTVCAGENGIQLIEVQIGKEINVNDKHKYDWPENIVMK